jgi:hypothetical protein
MQMSKHIELAKKLKALSEKGIGGEKITAEKMLNDLLKKYNITIEEIEGEKIQDYYFSVSENDFDLFNQIVKCVKYSIKVYGRFPIKMIKDYSLGGNHSIKCTASEYVEVEAKFSLYKKLYREELKIFYSAFLKANGLLIDNPNKTEPTPEEIEKYRRVKEMSEKIKRGQYLKQLTAALRF